MKAVDRFGTSCTGSRLLNGNLGLHEQLERELAAYIGKPSALVFSTGYHANVGTLGALLTSDDVALLDSHVHASLIDGCRMTRARVMTFAHNDPDALAARLAGAPPGKSVLVVVDGVYSMSGQACRLDQIVEVCARANLDSRSGS